MKNAALLDARPDSGGDAVPTAGASTIASGATTANTHEPSTTERHTRRAVLQQLLSGGPTTAAELAGTLGLSAAAIRRHLDALLAAGLITSQLPTPRASRGRGRPARVYLLTDAGRAQLPHGYDLLAADALEFLGETAGPEALAQFARRRAEAVLAPVADRLAAATTITERVQILAAALTDAGFAASVEPVGSIGDGSGGELATGEQLCQHHCPVAHVAARFPQLCEAELEVFEKATGTYAQRLATIARGDSFCTSYIPAALVVRHTAAEPRTTPQQNRTGS